MFTQDKLGLAFGAKRHLHTRKLYTTTRIALQHRNWLQEIRFAR